MGKMYAVVVGFVLLLVGIIGFVTGDAGIMGLHFSLAHNVIHVVSGLVGLGAGLGAGEKGGRAFAQVFGVVYTIVAIIGFVGAPQIIVDMLNLNLHYNLIHLVVGVLGLAAGFMGGSARAGS
ncbi:MAG TPA: DUF4383 domain-containing protein [Candidatus Limnocylindrales bacterium]|nr:DUF4383 domain-containing protein [Candidatus Limnocylindrales bacterium]